MIRLHLLGSVRLLDGDGRDIRAVLQQPKRLALLAFLAAARPRGPQRRDTLTGMFWGESDEASARKSLSQAIYFLRQKIHPALFAGRFGEEIELSAGEVWCDVVEFEALLEAGRTADALNLYTGELMPGFHISEAPEWEKWLDGERDRLRGRASEAAWALAASEEQVGNAGMAAHWARWAAALTPFDEQAHRKVLELLVRTGDRAGALRTHEEFARRLAVEYEVEPSPETAALVEAIRRDAGGGETDAMVEKAAQGLVRREPSAEAEHRRAAAVRAGLIEAAGAMNPAPQDHTAVAAVGGQPEHGTSPDGSGVRAVFRPARRQRTKHMTLRRGSVAILVALVLVSGLYVALSEFSRSRDPLAIGPEQPLDRIAILPFRDVSEGGQLAHVADGLAATLTDRLTGVGRLSIVSPSTTRQFAAATFDSIGRALNVGALVGATVARSDDRLRVHVELIDARVGTTLAASTVEKEQGDLFALLDSMAMSVEWMLREQLGHQVERREYRRETESQRAWELVQIARQERLNPAPGGNAATSIETALRHLDEAIRLDPHYVGAWVERSRTFHAAALLQTGDPLALLDSAEAAGNRAIAEGPNDAEALEQRAAIRFIASIYATEEKPELLEQAEADARAALAVDPYRARAESLLSQIYVIRGDYRRAHDAALRAYRADAYAGNVEDVLHRLFETAFELGNDDEAAKWCDEMRRRAEGSWLRYRCELMLLAFGREGTPDVRKSLLALDAARRVPYVADNRQINAQLTALVGVSYARAGMADSARVVLARAVAASAGASMVRPLAANGLLRIGEQERALVLIREYMEALPRDRQRLLGSRILEPLDSTGRRLLNATDR
ncbi:MAG TPA: BTAD domain-containing putative transcriptional regulator [Longimicrobiales bacterium]|nr:BTAD domain-containing putative transcriptional regulator [Longimicrobiales bacterium]